MRKILHKYFPEFDNISQTLLVLQKASEVVSVTSFANVIGGHFGIGTARVTFF